MTLVLPPFIAESWIGKFCNFTDPLPTPDIFKLWSGVSCVMGALERRCWIRVLGNTTYASSYIILVAPPGVGKSMIVREVSKFWLATGTLKIGPDAATKAAMVDALAAAQRSYKDGTELVSFHSLQLAKDQKSQMERQFKPKDSLVFKNLNIVE